MVRPEFFKEAQMQAKAKSNSIVTQSIPKPDDTFEMSIRLPKVLRYTVLGIGELDFHLDRVHADNLAYSCIHGWGQRVPDAAAIGVTDSEGNMIPKEQRTRMKYHAMNEIITHYESGSEDWSRAGSGGGQRSITIEAIARVLDVEYEEATEYVQNHAEKKYGGDTKKALAQLRKGKRVMDAMEEIRRERTPEPKVDADAELEELKAA
jgi:hypothetical protein